MRLTNSKNARARSSDSLAGKNTEADHKQEESSKVRHGRTFTITTQFHYVKDAKGSFIGSLKT